VITTPAPRVATSKRNIARSTVTREDAVFLAFLVCWLAAIVVCAIRNIDRVDHFSVLMRAAPDDPAGPAVERLSMSTYSGRLVIAVTIYRGDATGARPGQTFWASSVRRGLRIPPTVTGWIRDGVAVDKYGFGYGSGVTDRSEYPKRYELTSTMLMVPLWALGVPPALLFLWRLKRVRSAYVARRKAIDGCCARCGYDLRGSRARCPECGMASAESGG
jgi:hypothetical protein